MAHLYLRPHHLESIYQARDTLEIYGFDEIVKKWAKTYIDTDFVRRSLERMLSVSSEDLITLVEGPVEDCFCSDGCPLFDYCLEETPEQLDLVAQRLSVQYGINPDTWKQTYLVRVDSGNLNELVIPSTHKTDLLTLNDHFFREPLVIGQTYKLRDLILLDF